MPVGTYGRCHFWGTKVLPETHFSLISDGKSSIPAHIDSTDSILWNASGSFGWVDNIISGRVHADLVTVTRQRARIGVVQTGRLSGRAVLPAKLNYRRMAEAAFRRGHVALQIRTDGLVVGVGRGQSHPAGDAVDVRIDGEHAAATACEQQDAISGLWPDTVHVKQRRPHLLGVAVPNKRIKASFAAVLLADALCQCDDALGFLVVQPGRGDGFSEFGLVGVGQRAGEVSAVNVSLAVRVLPAAIPSHQVVVGRLARFVGCVLAENRPDETLVGVPAAVGFRPVDEIISG